MKYITPFGYTEEAGIILDGSPDEKLVLPGMPYAAIGIAAAYWEYRKRI